MVGSLYFCQYLRTFSFSFIQIDSHVKRLDEDLTIFAEDLKHGMVHASWVIQFLVFLFLEVF